MMEGRTCILRSFYYFSRYLFECCRFNSESQPCSSCCRIFSLVSLSYFSWFGSCPFYCHSLFGRNCSSNSSFCRLLLSSSSLCRWLLGNSPLRRWSLGSFSVCRWSLCSSSFRRWSLGSSSFCRWSLGSFFGGFPFLWARSHYSKKFKIISLIMQ